MNGSPFDESGGFCDGTDHDWQILTDGESVALLIGTH
jgi:hypothetical protein